MLFTRRHGPGARPGVRENGAQNTHATTEDDVGRYKVEPYVVAADIHTADQHLGRGGWTWYTGSASWLYRTGLEAILGFDKKGDTLRMNPRIPAKWDGFTIDYQRHLTTYLIEVRYPEHLERGVKCVVVDGVTVADGTVRLVNEEVRHTVTMGNKRETVGL